MNEQNTEENKQSHGQAEIKRAIDEHQVEKDEYQNQSQEEIQLDSKGRVEDEKNRSHNETQQKTIDVHQAEDIEEEDASQNRSRGEIKHESKGRVEDGKYQSHNETQQTMDEHQGKDKEEEDENQNQSKEGIKHTIGEHQVEYEDKGDGNQGQGNEEIKHEYEDRAEEEKNQSHDEEQKGDNDICHSSDFERSTSENNQDASFDYNDSEEDATPDDMSTLESTPGSGGAKPKKISGLKKKVAGFFVKPFKSSDTKTHKSDSTPSSKTKKRSSDTNTHKSDSTQSSKPKNESSDTNTHKSDSTKSSKPKDESSDTNTHKSDSTQSSKPKNESSKTKHDIPNVDPPITSKQWCKLQIFERPMCLISTNKEGNFFIEDKALNQIKEIDCPLVVVAIAGMYRTGKSYLMNRLAGSNVGFPLGNTVDAVTKGIWAWCRPHPKKEDHVLLLLDTEGLGDVGKGNLLHDSKIFTLAALLCNVLVYNMMSTINHDAVEKLTFITEMSKNINFKSRSEMDQYSDDKLALILPTFVLCLRDFVLELKTDGVQISSDQYLEKCLDLKPGKDNDAQKYNRPRKCIRKYFPTRRCFTFDMPGGREIIQNLDKVHVKDLSKAFVEETEFFIHFVYGCNGKVLLSSKPVTGIMLASLTESYVHAIQNGAVPDVDDAISVVSKLENQRASDKAVQSFSKQMKRIKLPVFKEDDFRKLFQSIQESSLLIFRQDAMFDTEPFEKEAVIKMEELWKQMSMENTNLIQKHCNEQLLEVYDSSVGKRMRNREYNVVGGHSMYRIELEALKLNYHTRTKIIEHYQAQHVLHTFLKDEVMKERQIMMADQKLTEEDRKRELDKIQKENQKTQTEQKKLFETMLKEEKERSEKHFTKMEKDRQMYLEQEKEKMKILMEKWKDQKELSEKQIQMMTTENEKQREEFKLEIRRLNDENLLRETEREKRFENLLENEQIKYQHQLDEINEKFKNLLDIEMQENMKREQEVKRIRNELQETIKKKDAERLNLEHEKNKLQDDKKNAEKQAAQAAEETKKVEKEKEFLTSEYKKSKQEEEKKARRLEKEKEELANDKKKEKEKREASEKTVNRLTKRNVLERLFNFDF